MKNWHLSVVLAFIIGMLVGMSYSLGKIEGQLGLLLESCEVRYEL